MLTKSMPAVISALNGSLTDTQLRGLVQSLGNCGAEVAHRGPVTVMPSLDRGANSAWNPSATFPGGWIPGPGTGYQGGNPFVELPNGANLFSFGNSGNSWHSTQYGSPVYGFNSAINNTLNSFFGGPTSFFGGSSYFDRITTSELTLLNPPTGPGADGLRVVGDLGADGAAGAGGPAGPPGQAGAPGQFGVFGVFAGQPGQPAALRLNLQPAPGQPPVPRRPRVVERDNAQAPPVDVVIGVEFDEDTCEIVLKKRPLSLRTEPKYGPRYYSPDNGSG